MVSFEATVYRVLIASPGDLAEERDRIERVVHGWNMTHADADRVVLLPVRWETHAVPEYGARPQDVINRGIVADCDILIGAFWTRLGTPTGISESGTLEEIEQFYQAGKPVLLYFSAKPINPNQVDWDQLRRVREFRTRLEQIALVAEFDSPADLQIKLTGHLHDRVRRLRSRSPAPAPQPGTDAPPPAPQVANPPVPAPQAASPTPTGARVRLNEQALGALYAEYWDTFSDVVRRSDLGLRPPSPTSSNYARISLGSGGKRLNAFASVRDRLIGVELILRRPACVKDFSRLIAAQAEIEQELGHPLEWKEHPGSYRIALVRRGFDLMDRADWIRQHDLLIEMMKAYQQTLLKRIDARP
jgi:hypothetical protein